MIDPTSPETQKKILQGDIALLEDQRLQLQDDIKRLARIRAEEYEGHKRELEDFNKQKNDLLFSVQNLKINRSMLADDAQAITKGIEVHKENEVAEIRDRLQKSKDEAEAMIKQLQEQINKNEEEELHLKHIKEEVQQQQEDLLKIEKDIAQRDKESRELQIKTSNQATEVLKAVQDAGETRDRLISEVESASAQLQKLNDQIAKQEESIKQKENDLYIKIDKLMAKEKNLKAIEQGLVDQENILKKKETWLKDREETLKRAFNEVMEKGGNNG